MERQEKRKEQELQKKPPFIVGRVHHNFYSPIKTTKNSGVITKKKIVQTQKKFNNQKGITRATREKKLLLDPAAVFLKTPLFGGVCIKQIANKNNIFICNNSMESVIPINVTIFYNHQFFSCVLILFSALFKYTGLNKGVRFSA